MLTQVEGSLAVAESVALCRPEVICAYPITPQTHIVEGLSEIVKAGRIARCEFINVESEFAAMSVAIGASAGGARAYTATSSQGLLFMCEAVYNAAGLGLPIVMTIGNRAIGAPINIWNDHSDSMSMRDSGWIQMHAATNQEAADLHIQAFRLAEELSTPVMVCMDGYVLTHAFEAVDIPDQEAVDAFLPAYEPRMVLDPREPVSIGALVGPEAYMEVRYLLHEKQLQALRLIPELRRRFEQQFGRASGGLLETYHTEGASTVVIALGSVNGTIQDVVDEMRGEGVPIGSVSLCTYRPFPLDAVREALCSAQRVVVVEKSLAVGMGGMLEADVRIALEGTDTSVHTIIAGLGGRPIYRSSLRRAFREAVAGPMPRLGFLDLRSELVERQLERERSARKSGPVAENVLHDAKATSARSSARTRKRANGKTPTREANQ